MRVAIHVENALDCDLMGMMYVLDEPSIVLHPKDVGSLVTMLRHLRDKGNSKSLTKQLCKWNSEKSVTKLHRGSNIAGKQGATAIRRRRSVKLSHGVREFDAMFWLLALLGLPDGVRSKHASYLGKLQGSPKHDLKTACKFQVAQAL